MTYAFGATYPYTPPRGITYGPEIAPVWHALIVKSGKERAVRDYLRLRDVFAFFPSEERARRQRGVMIVRECPMVSGQVYARFTQAPQWDVMKQQRRLILGVYANGEIPMSIPTQIIRHLQGMTVEAEALRAAQAEMLRIREGDRATINAGPLAGFAVDVESIRGGVAWFTTLAGVKGSAHIAQLDRIMP